MWKFYLLNLIKPLSNISLSVMVLYFLAIGFSPTLIGIIWSASTFFVVLFELPTGAIADIYGRKLSVNIGTLMNAISVFILFLTINPWMVFFSFVLASIGFTFISGAEDAWFVDYFLKFGKKNELNKVISRKNSIFSFMSFFVHIISSVFLLAFKDSFGFANAVRMMFLIESIFMLLCFMISLFISEPYFKKKKIKNYFRDSLHESKIIFKKSLKEITSNKKLLNIFIACSVLFFGSVSMSMGWNIQLNLNGIDESHMGFIFAFGYFISFLLLSFNEKISKRAKSKGIILSSVFMLGVLMALFSFNLGIILVVIWLIFSGMWDLGFNAISIKINELIPSKIRSTVLSMKAIADFFPTMLGQIFVFGLVFDFFGIGASILAGSIFFFISLFFFNKT